MGAYQEIDPAKAVAVLDGILRDQGLDGIDLSSERDLRPSVKTNKRLPFRGSNEADQDPRDVLLKAIAERKENTGPDPFEQAITVLLTTPDGDLDGLSAEMVQEAIKDPALKKQMQKIILQVIQLDFEQRQHLIIALKEALQKAHRRQDPDVEIDPKPDAEYE